MSSTQRVVSDAVKAEEAAWVAVDRCRKALVAAEADAKRAHAWTVGVQRLRDKLEGAELQAPVGSESEIMMVA